MAILTRLAIAAENPRRLAEFYRQAFDLKTVREDEMGISLSDGVFNLSLLRVSPGRSRGFTYVGFRVEAIENVRNRLEKFETRVSCPGDGSNTESPGQTSRG